MLRRPVRQVHVRFAPEEPQPKKAKKINKEDSELVLLLQTEFNYLYRLYDGVPPRRSTHCASRAMPCLQVLCVSR